MLYSHPPYINAVQFAELDSYDILGVSAMISRKVPNTRIRYKLAATGEGPRRLLRIPSVRLSCIDDGFIDTEMKW